MKKVWTLIFALALMLTFLVGCADSGADSGGPGGSSEPVTIRLYGLNSGWTEVMDRAAADFNEQTGNTLEVEIAGDDYSAVLKTRFASDEAPDIFELANSDIASWADQLADLSDCAFTETLYDSAKEFVYIDGACYGFPHGVSAGGFVYNKDLFAQAGIEEVPTTLDELEAACVKLEAAGIQPFGETWKEWGYLAQIFAYPFLYEDDLQVLAGKLNSGEMKLADLSLMDNFFRLYDMTLDYGLGAESIGYGVYDQVADFAAGKMAMIKQGTWLESTLLAANPDLNIGIFAAPLTNNAGDTKLPVATAGALVVNKNSEVADAAKEFLNFFYDNVQEYLVDGMMVAVPYEGTDASNLGALNSDMYAYMDEGRTFDSLGMDYWPAGYLFDVATPLQAYAADAATAEDTISELQTLYDSRVNSAG